MDDSNLDFNDDDDMGNPTFVLPIITACFSYCYESDSEELRDNEFHNGKAHVDVDQQNVLNTTQVCNENHLIDMNVKSINDLLKKFKWNKKELISQIIVEQTPTVQNTKTSMHYFKNHFSKELYDIDI